MTLPHDLRVRVGTRAQGRCEYCGLPEREALHPHQVDHIIPRQHGGADAEDNLAVTPEGRATAFIFRFNDDVRVAQRQALMRHGRYLG